jgi:hypothetical protein
LNPFFVGQSGRHKLIRIVANPVTSGSPSLPATTVVQAHGARPISADPQAGKSPARRLAAPLQHRRKKLAGRRAISFAGAPPVVKLNP